MKRSSNAIDPEAMHGRTLIARRRAICEAPERRRGDDTLKQQICMSTVWQCDVISKKKHE